MQRISPAAWIAGLRSILSVVIIYSCPGRALTPWSSVTFTVAISVLNVGGAFVDHAIGALNTGDACMDVAKGVAAGS